MGGVSLSTLRILNCSWKDAVLKSYPWRAQGNPVPALGHAVSSTLSKLGKWRDDGGDDDDDDGDNGASALMLMRWVPVSSSFPE